MFSRREALRHMTATGSSLALAPLLMQMRAEAAGDDRRLPKRFVFIVRSNGILATEIQPKGLEHHVKTRANGGWQTKEHNVPLAKHKLHDAMSPLEPLKNRLTIFQGLSGKMCRGSHNASFGALGAYASGQALPPRLETIDGALAKSLGGVFPHLGFSMGAEGESIIYPNLSAAGANKSLPYYADPMMAYRDLFGTIATQKSAKAANAIDRNILDFLADDVRRFQKRLSVPEKEKLDHYLHGFEALQKRQKKLLAMKATLQKVAPKLKQSYTSKVEIERLKAHFELAGAALIGGLTQVVAIRADNMGMRLEGLGLGAKTVHQMGHMIEGAKGGAGGENFADGKGEFAARAVVLKFHMQQIAQMAAKLAAVREGDGTMLDNTMIVYLSDHGDRHHSKFFEWPMIALGNVGGKMKTGRYLHVPGYGSRGHRTIANLYLSLLHAAGAPRDQFGQKDLAMEASISQTGPLAQWMR